MTEGRLEPKRCSFCGEAECKLRPMFVKASASICLLCAISLVDGYNRQQNQRRNDHSLEQARVLGGQSAPPTRPWHEPPDWFRRQQASRAFRWKSRIPHTCGDNPDLPCKGCAVYLEQPDWFRLDQAKVLGQRS